MSALSYDERTNTYEWQLKLVPASLTEQEKLVIERHRLNLDKASIIKAMVLKRFKNIEIAAALTKLYGRGYGLRTVAKYAALLRQNMK